MKTYRIQKQTADGWEEIRIANSLHAVETQSVQYARGFQDALQFLHPEWTTRIVWVRGCRYETVRMCGNRPPAPQPLFSVKPPYQLGD